MASFVTNHLEQYLPEYTLPLYVKEMITGRHPARQMHGHTFMEIVLIHSGQGLHLAGKSAVEIRAGDLLLIHPGLSHGYDNVGSLGLINLIYDPDKLPLPVLDGSQMPLFHQFLTVHRALSPEAVARPLLRLSPLEVKNVTARMRKLRRELDSNHPGRNFSALALFMEILTALCRSKNAATLHGPAQFLIDEAIRYMHDHLSEPIDLDVLPQLVNMSRRSFFRRFRQATGTTPGEYLKELRFSRAMDLLRRTDLPLTDISIRCGFCDGNYLCRLFRRRMGITPRQFRTLGSR